MWGQWEATEGRPEEREELQQAALRQIWSTPRPLVRAVEDLLGYRFVLDLAADEDVTVAPYWLGPRSSISEDAFTHDWAAAYEQAHAGCPSRCGAFLNPDFLRKDRWVQRLLQTTVPTILVLPGSTDQPWFGDLLESPQAHLTALTGRVKFVPPRGVKASSPRVWTVLWAVNYRYAPLPPRLYTDDLMSRGGQLLALDP